MPTNIIATMIEGLDGALLAQGQLCLTPVSTLTGLPTAFSTGDGQILARQVCFSVTNGSIGGAVHVADTSESSPAVGYLARVLDAQGIEISTLSQPIFPTGATWSLDDWSPTQTLPILPAFTISSGSVPPQGTCTAPSLYYENETAVWGCVGSAWVQIVGAEGPQGEQGVAGPRGADGPQGEQGIPGNTTGQVSSDWDAVTAPAAILNKPTIPVVPPNISAFINDAGYLATVTASEVTGLATVATSGSYPDLSNRPAIPAAQVSADWNATIAPAQILNKPTIPAAQVEPDWNASSGLGQILNKPTIPTVPTLVSAFTNDADYLTPASTVPATSVTGLATVATSGQYVDLSSKPTIPPGQVNSDWNATSGLPQILNKPTIPAAQVSSDWNAVAAPALILNKPVIPVVPTVISAFTNDTGYLTTVPTATNSVVGISKPDGTTITVTAGVLTAVGAAASGTVGGDLSGTLPNPTVAKINGATPGDIVTHNAADFQAAGASLQMSANLSDLASVATARTNLGLGTAALQPSTAFDAAGAAASAITSAEAFSSNATNLTSGTVAAARIPTLNQSTTGNAATATNVPYTGLTGSVPTWNQSTTGNAANVTGIVAVVNGGTGSSTAAFSGANITALNATNISTGTLAAARLPSSLSATSFTGNVSIAGTLGVTGASTVASLAATSLTISGLTTHNGQCNVTTAVTSTLPFAITNSTTAGCIQFSPSGSALTGSGWNTSIQSGDNVLLYTNSATAGSGVFNIVPFGTGGGLRMDGSGNTKITGTLTVTGNITAGGLTLNSSIVVGGSIIATTGAGSPQIEAESSVTGGWTLFYAAGTCPTGNNSIIQSSDNVLLFSNTGSSGTGTLALAPYLTTGGGGLRINNAGNVAITGTLTVSGVATFSSDVQVKHLIGGGSAPTIAIGAGTGNTVSVTGTDTAGVITLTTGSSPATQTTQATLTFAAPYSVTPVFIFQATGGGGGYNAAALSGGSQVWVSPSTTGVVLNSGNVALAASTQYIWNYISVAP